MKKLTKRQQKRIDYFLREKQSRREKQDMIHNASLPKFIEKRLPIVRRLSRNLDQLLIVSSFVSPPLKTGMIDRLLVVAELEKIEAIICLNKTDLLDDFSKAEHLAERYRSIGYSVILTSAEMGSGLEALNKAVRKKRSALAGHSGVGKSSLLNAIEPQLQISVGAVSDSNNKGTHTTTQVTRYSLDEETELVDLPGIKHLDFVDIHRDEARFYFKEFASAAHNCKFNDCLHLSEHKCAIKSSVDQGLISQERYQSYVTFVESLSS